MEEAVAAQDEELAARTSRIEEISRLLALDAKMSFDLDSVEPRSLEEVADSVARAMSELRRLSEDSPRTLVARFEGGICVICDQPINIGDAIAIAYQDAPPDVEGWRHDRCFRGGTGDRARVSPPGNPPRRSDIRRRLFLAEGDD